MDETLLTEFADLEEGTSPAVIRVWQNQTCLVVSRADTRLPQFELARAQLLQEGVPVVVRGSGGTAVLHGEGVINVSLIYRCEGGFRVESSYRMLCEWVASALNRMGIVATHGSVAGAFCDGRFNLIAGGKKIAGTAQKVRRTARGLAVLSHMSLLLSAEPEAYVGLLQKFYRRSGCDRVLDPQAVTSVAELLSVNENRSATLGTKLQQRFVTSLYQSAEGFSL